MLYSTEQKTSEPALALQVDQLGKRYGSNQILQDISFSLPAGETLAVIGPSGCGKSTLLYLLAGLTNPSEGSVSFNGTNTKGKRAFILQDYGLFPWKTVAENLALPLNLQGVEQKEQHRAVHSMLQELGLAGLEQRYPAQLSGGQRQRVAVGRALITEPELLLMDEPFSSLDALTREHLQHIVLALWERRRPTCVLVTHNVTEAVFLGKKILVVRGHPGKEVLWIENPCFGDPSCLESEKSLAIIRRIYAALGTED